MIPKYTTQPERNPKTDPIAMFLRLLINTDTTGIIKIIMPTGLVKDRKKAAIHASQGLAPTLNTKKHTNKKKNSDSEKPIQNVIELGKSIFAKTMLHAILRDMVRAAHLKSNNKPMAQNPILINAETNGLQYNPDS